MLLFSVSFYSFSCRCLGFRYVDPGNRHELVAYLPNIFCKPNFHLSVLSDHVTWSRAE